MASNAHPRNYETGVDESGAYLAVDPATSHSGTLIKKENQIFLIYKEIQNGAVAKSYMGKYLDISSYIWKPFLIYDFATTPL